MLIHSRFQIAFALTLALGGTLVPHQARAADITLDMNSCQATFGGTWSFAGSVCVVQNFSLAAADALTVPAPVRLSLGGASVNRGDIAVEAGANLYLGGGDTLENRGAVLVFGNFDNYGEVENVAAGGVSVSEGSILNEGEIVNSDADTYLTNFKGLIDNYGTISNRDDEAFVRNSTLAYLKNRGGLIEILAGELVNTDQGTVSNVNHGLITISDNASFGNIGPSSLVLNRTLGEIVNNGTFTNFSFSVVDNRGTFENRSRFDNSAWAVVHNEDGGIFTNVGSFDNLDDGQLENLGVFSTPGDLDNACVGVITNFGTGVLTGAFENWGGFASNFGTWNPGPTQRACDHSPP
jgi:hypothetical protein